MGYKTYLSGIVFGTVLSGAAFLLVTASLDPSKGFLSLAAFLGSLFFLMFGLATLAGFYGRRIIFGNEVLYANVGLASRQGFLIAMYIDIILLLKAYDILIWWDAALLFLSFILVELFFRSKE
ncbi:hypothetical protein COY62_01080 [bacterium (Candidatus Howlettbacteria) CG_4_10_14_0_8_um_filter_40_9]|nr:MAG: hypothetical protein COY62_01080 [bacterium (Candidatus Howlettbacteria) CG_4_10_14_0_8_um_filter_40_9]